MAFGKGAGLSLLECQVLSESWGLVLLIHPGCYR
jgi:hypothetical protein